ncbi:MAG: HAMP domain-containing histidine kinase [Acidobacteria bacterium]|nr:HAMP domain-containing histidine kinase [Acidobacteriota bacterium]
MQAHPQSNSAARIHRTHATPGPSSIPSHQQPSNRVHLAANPSPTLNPVTPPLADSAGLAHDAGNLLQALGLYCELLGLPGVLRPEHAHYAAELTLISNRSAELIRRLLALPPAATPTRPDLDNVSNRVNPHPADILRDIAPVLQSVASGIATVTVSCAQSLAYVDFPSPITAEVIERITVNLVRNASEAIRKQRSASPILLPRSEIRINFGVVANRLQLTVEDNGPGMPPAMAAAFLHPSPLPIGAKRGLGHRIVHELATGSGGHISVRVRPGNGTVFSVKWPLLHLVSQHLSSSRHSLTS